MCNIIASFEQRNQGEKSAYDEEIFFSPRQRKGSLIYPCRKVMTKWNELKYELLLHPLYSSYLVPSDYYLFFNLKKYLQEDIYASNEDIKRRTDEYFATLKKSYYVKGIQMLQNRWQKCISFEGNCWRMKHIKKKKWFFSLLIPGFFTPSGMRKVLSA